MVKVTFHPAEEQEDSDVPIQRYRKLVKDVCRRFNAPETTVSVVLADDAEITTLNSRYLHKKRTTDVLSFDLSENENTQIFELIVNAQMATRQAHARQHDPASELALYIVHGLLHNLGFDDSSTTHAETMHEMEDEILQQNGFGMVYNRPERS
jgi:probable rRNA maturation factor